MRSIQNINTRVGLFKILSKDTKYIKKKKKSHQVIFQFSIRENNSRVRKRHYNWCFSIEISVYRMPPMNEWIGDHSLWHIHVVGRCLRRLRIQRQTEIFLLHRSFLPPMSVLLLLPFFPTSSFLFFVRLDRPQRRWLTDAPCRCTLTCSVSLLTYLLRASSFPFSFSWIDRLLSTHLSCAARGDDDDGDDYRLLRTFLRIRAFQRLARPSADLCDVIFAR